MKKDNRTSIGGQAVLEGVMMRGKKSMAIAVRDEDGVIRLETSRTRPIKCRKIPIIRGIVSFVQSLYSGTAVLMRSADVYGEGEPSKFEKWLAEKLHVNVMSLIGFFSIILGLVFAVGLFIVLPQIIRTWLGNLFNIDFNTRVWAKNFIEGGIKLLVFLGYILLCSLLKDIRRTFMYHGAEHKTISCYEKGLPLTVENARSCTRLHDRCGTTFIFLVMFVSILVSACFESILAVNSVYLDKAYRVLCKFALLPLVAGISYEILKALAKTQSKLFLPIKAPGLLLQKITTREPDDKMLEVAITSFNAVLSMDADDSIPERKFVVPMKRSEILSSVREKLLKNGINEEAESEWIVSLSLGIKRDALKTDAMVSPSKIEIINKIVDERITGRPLWYCIGDTDFYGYKIKVDERVLIPRPETEILVEKALENINSEKTVLDLCTGSGAIAVAVKLKTNAKVCASDISKNAIALATFNARLNNADIEFIESDLFNGLQGKKFDVILSNPPYIKSDDIETLQREVKDFEPRVALDGGKDGLDFYRRIASEVKNYLTENGVVLLECGYNQAESVKNLFDGFSNVEIIKDYEGIDRIVRAIL